MEESMKIYTSYFGIANKFPPNFTLVSIALKTPDWFKGKTYPHLAPSSSILSQYKQCQNQSVYVERYTNDILSKLDFDTVIRDLKKLSSENENIVLLCYEKSNEPCHRHIVSKWMRDNGIDCVEISLN